MKRLLLAAVFAASPLAAAYQYYFTDPLTGVDAAKWSTAGQVTPGSGGLRGELCIAAERGRGNQPAGQLPALLPQRHDAAAGHPRGPGAGLAR